MKKRSYLFIKFTNKNDFLYFLNYFFNLHLLIEFFYEQSNYKIGASENNLQLDLKVNEKKLFLVIIFKTLQKNILQYLKTRKPLRLLKRNIYL